MFSDRLGDPDADAILDALRSHPDGMTRTEIRDLFSRHLSADRIERALAVLLKGNLAAAENVSTPGRPIQLWRSVDATKAT